MPIPGGESPPPQPGACTYSVMPVESLVMPRGGSGQLLIDTADHCAWTIDNDAYWVSVNSPLSGVGRTIIDYDVAAYTESASKSNGDADVRRTPLQVRWDTPTAGQNVWIKQLSWCHLSLAAPTGRDGPPVNGRYPEFSVEIPAGGGRFHFWTFTESVFSCNWSKRSHAAWVTVAFQSFPIIHRGEFAGLTIDVEANTSGIDRTGRVEVAESFLTVIQRAQ